jgi:hypothetical protein
VYGREDEKLGEVAVFARDVPGAVDELHADVGEFPGFAETRFRVMPAQFEPMTDRVVP